MPFTVIKGAYLITLPPGVSIFSGLCERKYCPFGGECIITADNAAECTCITHCPDEFAPVCGTDNVTYASECRMKVASCTQEKRIIPRAQGSCGEYT